MTHFRGRTVIAFAVQPTRIEVLGLFHGGRSYAEVLHEPEEG